MKKISCKVNDDHSIIGVDNTFMTLHGVHKPGKTIEISDMCRRLVDWRIKMVDEILEIHIQCRNTFYLTN